MFQSPQFTSDTGLGRIAVAAFGLGFVMALHVALLIYYAVAIGVDATDRWHCVALWSVYMIALCFFHLSEFMLIASFRPSTVSYESFLLNHSKEYHLALVVSWVEFWLQVWLVPSWKANPTVFTTGVVLVVFGQWCRILAMWTAASNFSHRIEYIKRKEHVLVTHGIYRFIRHPSYTGWFFWTMGSQVVLANPLCTLGYSFVSWSFFRDRVPYEEHLLVQFFPDEYPQYRQRTISGVPFVR
ncbi:hypothetical protein Poli38472_010973 [Pythium oligandrum]|uniref:Protein-S-isoprenylcysteine O-methyltransferase n=1 Tax=Pythium oligandrum TaxID=41045 RepID=A0A8K1CFM5_PYTOL|nr:hypothetical protein Poli38472_010973 [Pythium oligandrum]|eukprot:TMW61910.1 hypothetical protein Poli38472_010973 [Pythium oligandrum]